MPKKVLIVEDDGFLLKMLTVGFEEKGHSIIPAKNGEEAVALLKKEKPDVILLDILMPKMDGFAVLEYMQKERLHIPTIVTSNLGQEEDVQKCKKLGAKDFLIKSDVEPEEIVKKVERLL